MRVLLADDRLGLSAVAANAADRPGYDPELACAGTSALVTLEAEAGLQRAILAFNPAKLGHVYRPGAAFWPILGELMQTKGSYSIADPGMSLHRLNETFWKSIVWTTRFDVDGVQSSWSQCFGIVLTAVRLRRVLTFMRSRHDWIVIDAGRFDLLVIDLVSNVDNCLRVASEDVSPVREAKRMVETPRANGKVSVTLVLNRRSLGQKWMENEIAKFVQGVLCCSLPVHSDMREAFWASKLNEYVLQLQFRELTTKLSGTPIPDEPKRSWPCLHEPVESRHRR